MKSLSESNKPHKFFERYLNNDLIFLTSELQKRYSEIEKMEVNKNNMWRSSNSVSTMLWKDYNVFQFHLPEIYNLYKAISDMTKEACEYYELDFDKEQFMLQGWFNINYAKKGKLDWHEHAPFGAPLFHGYYCVNAEPSKTHYIVFDKEVENHNKNNRAILSEMGHPHAMADWDWEGPRITIAYDVIPLSAFIGTEGSTIYNMAVKKGINPINEQKEQHWIPLI